MVQSPRLHPLTVTNIDAALDGGLEDYFSLNMADSQALCLLKMEKQNRILALKAGDCQHAKLRHECCN